MVLGTRLIATLLLRLHQHTIFFVSASSMDVSLSFCPISLLACLSDSRELVNSILSLLCKSNIETCLKVGHTPSLCEQTLFSLFELHDLYKI